MTASHDVIVIGAGAAGLAAAAALAAGGQRVLILEARERVGGRIWTRHEPGVAGPIELGAEFVHGYAEPNVEWLARAGHSVIETPDQHWRLENGELRQRDSFFHSVQEAFLRHKDEATHDISLDTFLETRLKDVLSPDARKYARMMAEGFDAADTSHVSARAILEEWTGDMMTNAPQSRPEGGYSSLLTALCGALPPDKVHFRLQTIVREVRWSRGSVEIRGVSMGSPFRASAPRAVITLPLGVLKLPEGAADAVSFSPPLDAKQPALEGLGFGPVIKIVMRFRTAFWDELDDGRYREVGFFHAPDYPIPTFWTALPVRAPILSAWIGGPRVNRVAAAEKAGSDGSPVLLKQAMRSLDAVFSGRCDISEQLVAAYVHDWQSDPFSHGAYSYVAVGGATAHRDLAAPLEDTLYFAGEATDISGETATVTGALASGERVAQEILSHAA